MSIFGVILGITGVTLLISQETIVTNENTLLGILMIFSAMLAWSYASIFVKKADLPKNYFVSTGYQMFSGGIILAVMSLAFNEPWSSPMASKNPMGSGFAYYFWWYYSFYSLQLFAKACISRKGTYQYLRKPNYSFVFGLVFFSFVFL